MSSTLRTVLTTLARSQDLLLLPQATTKLQPGSVLSEEFTRLLTQGDRKVCTSTSRHISTSFGFGEPKHAPATPSLACQFNLQQQQQQQQQQQGQPAKRKLLLLQQLQKIRVTSACLPDEAAAHTARQQLTVTAMQGWDWTSHAWQQQDAWLQHQQQLQQWLGNVEPSDPSVYDLLFEDDTDQVANGERQSSDGISLSCVDDGSMDYMSCELGMELLYGDGFSEMELNENCADGWMDPFTQSVGGRCGFRFPQ
jgi:hypothetical protein